MYSLHPFPKETDFPATTLESAAHYMDCDAKVDLSRQFQNRIIRGYAIADFLRNVWRLDASFLEGLEERNHFCMKEELVERYVRGRWEKTFTKSGVRVEGEATAAFEQLGRSHSRFTPILSMHESNIRSTTSKYKPKFVTSPLDEDRYLRTLGCPHGLRSADKQALEAEGRPV